MNFDATQAHFDLADRVKSSPTFATIAVITEKARTLTPGDALYNPVQLALAAITGEGAAVLVMEPDLNDTSLSEPLYFKQVTFEIVCFISPMINASGQQIRSFAMARQCERLFRQFRSPGLYGKFLVATITPFRGEGLPREVLEPLQNAQAEGHTLKLVTQVQEAALTPCADPVADCAAPFTAPKTVTLTCATAGAKIYYTLDGSYPGSGRQPAAASYVTTGQTVAVAAASVLRIAAEAIGYEPSNVMNAEFA